MSKQQPNSETVALVKAAYDVVVRKALEDAARWNERFPVTDETRERWAKDVDDENNRRQNLMKDHMNEAGTTSVCRCGHSGYSTHGYLLHLYEVVEADVTRYWD